MTFAVQGCPSRFVSAQMAKDEPEEILPTRGLDPEDNEIKLTADEGIRQNIDPNKMAQLGTDFRPEGEGVVTERL